jgi:hypothetical protein
MRLARRLGDLVRVQVLALAAVLSASGGVGATAGHAAPPVSVRSAEAHPQVVPKKAPLLSVHVVAKDGGELDLFSSGNGTYVLAQGAGSNPSGGELFNTATNRQIGPEIGPPADAEVNGASLVGLDNKGTVYGDAERSVHGTDVTEGYTWSDGTAAWIPNPTAAQLAAYVDCFAPITDISVYVHAVNPQGEAVAEVSSSCGEEYTLAMIVNPQDKWSPTGKAGTSTLTGYAGAALAINAAGEVVGSLSPNHEPEYEWSARSGTAVSLASLTGFANAEATGNQPSRGTHFLGDGMTAAGSNALWNGTAAIDIPRRFGPQALGPRDEVVGYFGDNPQVAAVWYPGGKVTRLQELVHKTSVQLNLALAIDGRGDIFGTGTTSHGHVIFEARVPNPPPNVSITTPKPGHAYNKGASIKASFACKAGKSAVLKSCKGTVADHKAIVTSRVGTHSFTVVATDTDGEKTTKTVHYRIRK